MKENKVTIILLAFMAGLAIGPIITIYEVRKVTKELEEVRAEAVRRGIAVYMPDENNLPVFKWKDTLESKK